MFNYVNSDSIIFVRNWFDALTLAQNRLQNFENHELQRIVVKYFEKRPLKDALPLILESHNITENCFIQLKLFINELVEKQSLWTLKMIDADAKLPSGVLQFVFLWLGSFTECMNITAKVDLQDIQGKYCISTIGSSENSTGEIATLLNSFFAFYFGICVPHGCNENDAKQIMETVFSPLSQYVEVKQTACPARKLPFDTRAIIIIVLCSIFLFLMALGTLWDIILLHLMKKIDTEEVNESINKSPSEIVDEYTPLIKNFEKEKVSFKNSCISQFILCFSAYSSSAKIFNTKLSEGTLPCLHGIRFLSMSWVILGHSIVFGIVFYNNFAVIPDIIKSFLFQPIVNATVSVDSFFVLSGLLVGYLFMKEYAKNGSVSLLMFYCHRIWRLTPVYMLFLGIYVSLFKYFGQGPLWPQQGLERNYCQDSWWKNLLYINNFSSLTTMCLAWSWYLANDMQFYVISPIILYALCRQPIVGSIIALLITIASWITTGVLSAQNHFAASTLQMTNMTESNLYMDKIYIKPYCRIPVYLIGLICGYLIFRTENRINISKVAVILGWVGAVGTAYGVVYGLYDVNNGTVLSNNVNALYNSLNRSAWAFALCWVIFACVSGYGGPVNKILSWQVWIPLSRLTYCAYLVHPVVMYWYYYNNESPTEYSHLHMCVNFLSLLLMSYAAAFVLSITLESPMLALEKLVLKKKKD